MVVGYVWKSGGICGYSSAPEMERDELRGHLDSLILASLANGPSYGWAIIEHMKARSGGDISMAGGSVYPALHRLEREGLVASDWSTGTARPRRIYRLTDRGAAELGDRRARWRRFVSTIESVLTM
jgi:PadR family transcriptional regulator, regulatory protein PadR